jgi:diadenosine tetraphosphate (Ap4A) HIT family hydrolase
MANEKTLFDKIVEGLIPSKKVWEDKNFLAFLTPFPNTPGFTVVVPKVNPGDNFLTVDDIAFTDLLLAARKVAKVLQKAFGTQRIGLVIEGEGVPHLHVKLIPMIGQSDGLSRGPNHTEFYETYPGYLTTIEGPQMTEQQLDDVIKKIQETN